MHVTALFTVLCVLLVTSVYCNESNSELEKQLKLLSKQVTALLDRRKEDLQIIEDSLRNKLLNTFEVRDVQTEIRTLKLEIEELRNGNIHRIQPQHATKENNEHLTIKWLSNAVSELKTEVTEIQTTLNSTVILQNHEKVRAELSLLKTDIINLNKELEIAKGRNIKYETEMMELRGEVDSVKSYSKTTAVMCGKTKNQLKATQLEWNYNWKQLNEKSSLPLLENEQGHSTRHQRVLKKHLIDLEKSSRTLHKTNDDLNLRILKLEEEIHILQKLKIPQHDDIAGNEINNYLKAHELSDISRSSSDYRNLKNKIAKLEINQKLNNDAVLNISRQLTNFDKLHLSLLELLENVESIENKVDNNFPEFRKEISKIDIQIAEATSEIALLKEDQTNTRNSVKAISVSVSNIQDKVNSDCDAIDELKRSLENVEKSSSLQTSKLHDHILKTESSTIDVNATKSTIRLVQELKSFENEYKSIINKLPHDCNEVSGPNGIYLISPGDGEPIMANCQDGWTIIQKRYDGTINFNRNWNEYSNGFGSATGEHWLGNRNIHYLTKSNCTQLQINMKDIYGKYWLAAYEDFRVADYSFGFKLYISNFKGNASDALDYQNKMEFSTVDNDRDISNTHCASNYEGGWWFSHCQHANLNGRYNLGLTWFDNLRNEWIAVSTSEMRVKKRENC